MYLESCSVSGILSVAYSVRLFNRRVKSLFAFLYDDAHDT